MKKTLLILAVIVTSMMFSCKPESEEPNVKVTTSSVSDVAETSAKCGGTVTATGYTVGSCGLCYSESPNPTISSYITSDLIGTGTFTSTMSDLEPETKYYVRAYATTSYETLYGEQKEFTTIKIGTPTITTSDITDVTAVSAVCGGVVISDGNAPITERGICWNTSSEPTIDNHTIINSGDIGSFTSTMTNLSNNTTYYVRAYATNERGTSYGEEKSFRTESFYDGLINGHEYIDLGLPSGIKWATCNVGASIPEGYGNYYAWGEIAPKEKYSMYNYSLYGRMDDISGDAQYDAATANWGGTWKMPTKQDISELLKNCTFEWINMNGIKGYKVIGPNGRYIFLPATGYRKGSFLLDDNKSGNYWSSSPATDDYAYHHSFNSSNEDEYNDLDRSCGFTIRPVSD